MKAALALIALLGTARLAAAEPVEVVELAAQPAIAKTLSVRASELPTALPAAIISLLAIAQRNGLDVAGPPFARYLARGDTLVVEAGIPVRRKPVAKLRAGAVAVELPAGPAATVLYRGPHAQLAVAHAALDAWLASHDRREAGPRWEIYLTNPLSERDPGAQQTRIVAPLAADGARSATRAPGPAPGASGPSRSRR